MTVLAVLPKTSVVVKVVTYVVLVSVNALV